MAEPKSPIRVYQCGVGRERAHDAASAALSAGASALVSWGVAGALVPELSPGTILLPQQVLTCDGEELATDSRWRMDVYRALQPMFAVHGGRLLDSREVLSTRVAKTRVAQASGAIAVDMESAAVGRAAAGAGKPFVVLRVVVDALVDTLPRDVERWIDEAGNRRLIAAFEIAFRPACWPGLFKLSRRYRQALRALTDSAQVLVPQGFLYRQPPSARA
jgi:adenosylhomocysteine nucleosidase